MGNYMKFRKPAPDFDWLFIVWCIFSVLLSLAGTGFIFWAIWRFVMKYT